MINLELLFKCIPKEHSSSCILESLFCNEQIDNQDFGKNAFFGQYVLAILTKNMNLAQFLTQTRSFLVVYRNTVTPLSKMMILFLQTDHFKNIKMNCLTY